MSVTYNTNAGSDRWRAAAALHCESFKTDPVMRYMCQQFDDPERKNRISQLLFILMRFSGRSNAIFDEAWSSSTEEDLKSDQAPACSAVWFSPGQNVNSFANYLSVDAIKLLGTLGLGGIKRMAFDFQRSAEKGKENGLRNPDGSKIKDYYYLFFISTATEARGKGLSSELIRRFQEKATKENVSIWLESTTEKSHRLYLRLGFEDKSTWVIGEGQVDQEGNRKAGGSGVRLWSMLWQPQKDDEQK